LKPQPSRDEDINPHPALLFPIASISDFALPEACGPMAGWAGHDLWLRTKKIAPDLCPSLEPDGASNLTIDCSLGNFLMKRINLSQANSVTSRKWFRQRRRPNDPMLVFNLSIFNSGRSWEHLLGVIPPRENVWP
jgi:hypothetical protein